MLLVGTCIMDCSLGKLLEFLSKIYECPLYFSPILIRQVVIFQVVYILINQYFIQGDEARVRIEHVDLIN